MSTLTTNGHTDQVRSDAVVLERVSVGVIDVTVDGITPLITHKWSNKAKKMMRDKQTGKAKKASQRDPKVIAEEIEGATYRLPDGRPGVPAVAIKSAMVGAARLYDNVSMTELRRMLFVRGEGPEQLIPIEYEEMIEREDVVRISMGTSDLRYRPQFNGWSLTFTIEFAERIDGDSILNLLMAAGQFEGIGEWRPSSPKSATGTYGRFEVRGVAG